MHSFVDLVVSALRLVVSAKFGHYLNSCAATTSPCARVAGQFVPDAVPSGPEFTLPEFAVGLCRAALAARSQPLEGKHHVDEASCAQTSTEEARQLRGAV